MSSAALNDHTANDATPMCPTSRVLDALRDAGLLVSSLGTMPEQLTDFVDDSRRVRAGVAFVAVQGVVQDGHTWIATALEAGAALVIVEHADRLPTMPNAFPVVVVRDGRRAAAVAAAAFHHWPSRELTIVGVTGTNGKTTTVGLLRHVLHQADAPAASIGTLGVIIGDAIEAMPGGSGLTTPGPVELQRLLRQLRNTGVRSVAMEVSSHSLDQRRVEGITFAAVVFTNLTRDHLDYHGTMDDYRAAKLRLLHVMARDGTAIFNNDDPAWKAVPAVAHRMTFGVESPADVTARDVSFHPLGASFLLVAPSGAVPVELPLIGDFNVSNALAAASTAMALGHSLVSVAERLANAPQVPGRLERIWNAPTVLRDYAHTPDALDRALRAVRPFAHTASSTNASANEPGHASRLIVVFGCGGDRDRGKRPVMGEIAERLADVAILTSDNPRTEDPERILDDIEVGMPQMRHVRVVDRYEAIGYALRLAAASDVIVLAGKGHETYQIRGTESFPFDEREIVHGLMTVAPWESTP